MTEVFRHHPHQVGETYHEPFGAAARVGAAMIGAFRNHPREVGETYPEHFGAAVRFGAAMTLGGLACLVHAVFPFWFTDAASGRIQRLHERMAARRPVRLAANDDRAAQARSADIESHQAGSGI